MGQYISISSFFTAPFSLFLETFPLCFSHRPSLWMLNLYTLRFVFVQAATSRPNQLLSLFYMYQICIRIAHSTPTSSMRLWFWHSNDAAFHYFQRLTNLIIKVMNAAVRWFWIRVHKVLQASLSLFKAFPFPCSWALPVDRKFFWSHYKPLPLFPGFKLEILERGYSLSQPSTCM